MRLKLNIDGIRDKVSRQHSTTFLTIKMLFIYESAISHKFSCVLFDTKRVFKNNSHLGNIQINCNQLFSLMQLIPIFYNELLV